MGRIVLLPPNQRIRIGSTNAKMVFIINDL
jgi:hypothetical protein